MSGDNATDIVPLHKSDLERAAALDEMDDPRLAPFIPQLLGWLLDSNWPISRLVAPRLFRMGDPLVGPLTALLRGDDGSGKYHVISLMMGYMPRQSAEMFRAEIIRLAFAPSTDDIREEVPEIAQEALNWLGDRPSGL